MFNKPGLAGDILRIVLFGVGLSSLAAVVWMAGPFIVINGYRPLEDNIIREIVIALIVAAAASVAGWRFWKREKSAKDLAEGVVGEDAVEDDSVVLEGRLKDAIATLKKASGGRSFYLYDLPWYVIIGPPGAGKTTALVNSGLRFPLSGGATPAAVAGQGGTRYCDWWFTEDAVFIDTAGRYTTQDSDARADKRSWLRFLDLLKKNRPKQPINGVLVAISLSDMLLLGREELAAHAKAIRARLLELHDELKVDFPVYALFTKTDLVAGFGEYFANFDGERRRSVFGATFQTNDKKRNFVAETPKEFDALIERLNQTILDRLQEEPNPSNRVALYGFPAQMAALKRPVYDFLNAIFEPTRYHANANLRGFYFTSGTQQGTPIDQLINALVKNFGAEEAGGLGYGGVGKSYFLYDLIQKVIIPEAGWVSTDVAAVRRTMFLKGAAIAVILIVAAALTGVWWRSYSANAQLLADEETFAKEYIADPAYPITRAETVADADYGKTLALLERLRKSPTGYANRGATGDVLEAFGFSQRPRLTSASTTAYRLGLERLLRPRLLYRLEEALDQHRDDPGYLYEALKVYMMLGHVAPAVDRDLIRSWERQDFEQNYFRGAMADVGAALQEHVEAMLDLDSGDLLVKPNQTLIEDAQKLLGQLKLHERAYQLLKSQARADKLEDWRAAHAGGPYFDEVFEEASGKDLDTLRVPGFFTYDGFKRGFLGHLPGVADRLRAEKWVLGALGQNAGLESQYATLADDALTLYGKEFGAAWRSMLNGLRIKRLTSDKPRYKILGAVTASTSPLKLLFVSIDEETALTREHARGKNGAKDGTEDANAVALATLFPNRGGRPPGEEIEKQFLPIHEWVTGGETKRPIDELLAELNDIRDNLITSANVQADAPAANAALGRLVEKFRSTADRLPPPFREMMTGAAKAISGDVDDSLRAALAKAFGDQVAGACRQVAVGRYPFEKGSANEIALADFGRLFGANGVFDSFFKQSLAKYVDVSKREWTYRPEFTLTKTLSLATLREFQRAAQIRDAFFATGGSMPSIAVTVYPPVLSGPGLTARLAVNGSEVLSQAGVSVAPRAIQWPGAGDGSSSVSLSYGQPQASSSGPAFNMAAAPATPSPAPAPITLERAGPWSFFRLLDAAAKSYNGDRLVATFSLGGRNIGYGFVAGSTLKPLTLPALSEFRCPSQL